MVQKRNKIILPEAIYIKKITGEIKQQQNNSQHIHHKQEVLAKTAATYTNIVMTLMEYRVLHCKILQHKNQQHV